MIDDEGNVRKANFRLWILVMAYAAGIAIGSRMLPLDSVFAVSVAGLFTVLVVAPVVVWAGKRSNPRCGTAYGLLIVAFLIAGTVAGLNLNFGLTGRVKKPDGHDAEKIAVVKAVRKHIKGTIKGTMSARYRGLMTGIVLGETQDIPQDVEADFKATGLSHILAVSGLNISILIIAFGYLIRTATINMGQSGRIAAFAVTAGAVVFYMFITELQPSVVRAGLMGLAALVAILFSRRGDAFPALAAAAMAILVVEPAALFSIGFQLSFAATIAILIFTPKLETAFRAKHGGLGAAASLTLAAQLGVAPLLILYFGQLSLISITANVLVSPAISPATILGLLITLAGAVSIGLARVVAVIAEPCLAYIAGTARYFAGWPFASISLTPISAPYVAAYYVLLGLAYIGLVRYNDWRSTKATINDFPNRRFARTTTVSIILASFVVGLFGCQAVKSKPPPGLRAVFIDVGQGDATLIQAEDGATVLIDGGPEPERITTVLKSYGIKTIDLMIVTHAHSDHVGGLESVIEDLSIKKTVLPEGSSAQKQYRRIVKVLERNRVESATGRQGQDYAVGKYLKASILSPDEATLNITGADESDDANNRAVVTLIQYKKIKLMLAADIELSTEQSLIDDQDIEDVDVLKVPHHGSKNGANARFIEATQPEIAVISVGARNPFHHPAPSTLTKLRQVGAAVYRTDKNGSVIIESDGSTIHVSTSK